MSAAQSRAADLTSVSSTVCRSKVERLITLSTSGSRSAAERLHSVLQLVQQPGILDGDHRLVGEGRDQLNLLVRKWVHLIADQYEDTDWLPSRRSGTSKRGPVSRMPVEVEFGIGQHIWNMNDPVL